MSSHRQARNEYHSFDRHDFVPGTYQIVITRMDESGGEKSLTAYVPMSEGGKAELMRRHFEGYPHKKPEYFVK